jgi:hypothetical protein
MADLAFAEESEEDSLMSEGDITSMDMLLFIFLFYFVIPVTMFAPLMALVCFLRSLDRLYRGPVTWSLAMVAFLLCTFGVVVAADTYGLWVASVFAAGSVASLAAVGMCWFVSKEGTR